MKRLLLICLVATFVAPVSRVSAADDGWKTLFDGKSMKGWKANENKDSWKVVDGVLVCAGPRSHLFYTGDDKPFVNFEFKADVMTKPGSNAGIYFHTKYQEEGWPKNGYEVQVNVTHRDPKKTGSLYGVVNVSDPPCKDNEYWTQHVIVQGKQIVIKINGKTVVDYTEPENVKTDAKFTGRRLSNGTFAFQAHDPKSVVHFKNVMVKRLP
ncbi:MAG: DUF1080 domain-containing protein [Pirellulaceae bacterium]|jgi:hypothetical protein|nr:DUF1080 domain-containing protein [Pirellulaceae bacterium]MDP6553273.1 DUF1080 domain-containing protein [Pirellulaceae bacterium]MDP6717789.1 DUF1080 domain-containing protein [Pirellulaceae bacterium]